MNYLELMEGRQAEQTSERAAALADMESATAAAVSEERSALTADEDAVFAEARSRVDALDADIAVTAERIAELQALAQRADAAASAAPNVIIPANVEDTPRDVRRMSDAEAQDAAMRSLEDHRGSDHLRSDQLDKVDRLLRTRTADTDGGEIARRVLVTETPEYRDAFVKLVTQVQPILTAGESEAVNRFNEYRAASGGTDTAGGFGVPVLIDPSIVMTAQGSLNPFRAISRVETVTTDAWKGVSSAGVSWSYDAEAATVSDDAATVAQPTVPVHMARGFIPYSIEVGGDYPGFAAEMSRLLSEGYDELQASAFSTGTGSDQPTGILTALDANTNVEIATLTAGTIAGGDIGALWGGLPDRFKTNATWVMNHDVGNAVSSLSTSGMGSYYTVNISEENAPQLKGRPVAHATHFPDLTDTTGAAANIIVVGDFSNYLIADRAGMSVELVPHLFDVTNNRPTGQRGWFAWARNGADSINDLGFRLLQDHT